MRKKGRRRRYNINNASLASNRNISNNYNNIFIYLSSLKFYAEVARNLIDIINKKVYGNCSSDLELSLRKKTEKKKKKDKKRKNVVQTNGMKEKADAISCCICDTATGAVI